jgi:hypothetical protein
VVRPPAGPGPLVGVRQIHSNQSHTCAVLTNGQGRCWGQNTQRQLGNGQTADRSRPVRVQF